MNTRLELAKQLEARAGETRSLAEAQALQARADQLRGWRGGSFFLTGFPLLRN